MNSRVCGVCCAGVLLWEIFTGAETPYPAIDQSQISFFVCTEGVRLSQPERCPDVVFDIMSCCWAQVCSHFSNSGSSSIVASDLELIGLALLQVFTR